MPTRFRTVTFAIAEAVVNVFSAATIDLISDLGFTTQEVEAGMVLEGAEIYNEVNSDPVTASAINTTFTREVDITSSLQTALLNYNNSALLRKHRQIMHAGANASCINSERFEEWPVDKLVDPSRKNVINKLDHKIYCGIKSTNDTIAADCRIDFTFSIHG